MWNRYIFFQRAFSIDLGLFSSFRSLWSNFVSPISLFAWYGSYSGWMQYLHIYVWKHCIVQLWRLRGWWIDWWRFLGVPCIGLWLIVLVCIFCLPISPDDLFCVNAKISIWQPKIAKITKWSPKITKLLRPKIAKWWLRKC